MGDRPRLACWEGFGLAAFVVAFVVLRLPLYTEPGLTLGWNSDAALFGLMARAMAAGHVPLFFWGQDYLAPLTSAFALLAAAPLGEIGPLELRIGTAAEILAGVLFFHFGLRRCVGPRAAMSATLWLGAGPGQDGGFIPASHSWRCRRC